MTQAKLHLPYPEGPMDHARRLRLLECDQLVNKWRGIWDEACGFPPKPRWSAHKLAANSKPAVTGPADLNKEALLGNHIPGVVDGPGASNGIAGSETATSDGRRSQDHPRRMATT